MVGNIQGRDGNSAKPVPAKDSRMIVCQLKPHAIGSHCCVLILAVDFHAGIAQTPDAAFEARTCPDADSRFSNRQMKFRE